MELDKIEEYIDTETKIVLKNGFMYAGKITYVETFRDCSDPSTFTIDDKKDGPVEIDSSCVATISRV